MQQVGNRATKLGKLQTQLSDEGPVGVARWIANWTLWNTPLHRVLPTDYVEAAQLRYRYSRRVKKYGIQEPVIVYQMGKVGSASMYVSLLALELNVPVYHLHFLNDADQIAEWAKATLKVYDQELEMVALSHELRDEIERGSAPRYNLISLVRAPVPRNLSTYFHNIDSYFPDFLHRFETHTLSPQDLQAYFLNHFAETTPERWFDRQVRDVFGIDVYAEPFARQRGYQIYENAQARLLVLRLEDLNRVVETALAEFLNIPDFTLLPANIGEDKRFGAVYREFLSRLKLPVEYINHNNGTRYARHFYSDRELNTSVARWVSAA